jgi:hypothetical protein
MELKQRRRTMSTKNELVDFASVQLVGKRIKKVRYMDDDLKRSYGFPHAPIVIELEDGTEIIPMTDDDSNDGGALAVVNESGSFGLSLPAV